MQALLFQKQLLAMITVPHAASTFVSSHALQNSTCRSRAGCGNMTQLTRRYSRCSGERVGYTCSLLTDLR